MTDPAATVAPPSLPSRRQDERLMVWLGVVMAAALLLLSSGTITGADGPAVYEVAKSIVEEHDLTIPAPLGFRGVDDRLYDVHGLGLALISTLPYAAVRPVASRTSNPDLMTRAAVASTMPLVAALVVVAMFALSRTLGSDRKAALLVAVGAVVATYLFPYSKDFYSEPLATLFVVVSIQQTLAGKPVGAGLALAGAGITRPQTIALIPVVLWFVWRDQGVRALVQTGTLAASGVVIEAWYNFARFGDVLRINPLQGGLDFGGEWLEGASGLLFLPAKSVFLFAPVALLLASGSATLWSRSRAGFWLLTWNLVLTFAIAAAWPAWDGGYVWGPRLLIPGLIPALASLAPWLSEGGRGRWHVMIGLLALGFMVNLPGVLVSTRAQLVEPTSIHGPTIIRQSELIGPAFQFTKAHLFEHFSRPERYVDFWQSLVARSAGKGGLALAGLFSALLLAVFWWALGRFRSVWVRIDQESENPMQPVTEPAGTVDKRSRPE
jgi:hypothetical protein